MEHIVAESEDGKSLQLILLNQNHLHQNGTVELNLDEAGFSSDVKSVQLLDTSGKVVKTLEKSGKWAVDMEGFGLAVLKIEMQ